MPHCKKVKRRSHATAQRRNVKAQVMGEMAMGRLTVTGLTGFSAANAPFDDKGAIAPCGLHITGLRNISYSRLFCEERDDRTLDRVGLLR